MWLHNKIFSPESGKKKVCVCLLTRYIRTYPLSDADFAVGDTTHSLIATVPRRGFKIHNDINIQNHVINSSTDAHTHNAPPAIKVNAGYKESIGGAKNFNNKILKHIKSHLIMLSAFVMAHILHIGYGIIINRSHFSRITRLLRKLMAAILM